jgi:hypothetical protein
VRAGEPVCPVHLQAVYRLTIGPHHKVKGQANNLTKVGLGRGQQLMGRQAACNRH